MKSPFTFPSVLKIQTHLPFLRRSLRFVLLKDIPEETFFSSLMNNFDSCESLKKGLG